MANIQLPIPPTYKPQFIRAISSETRNPVYINLNRTDLLEVKDNHVSLSVLKGGQVMTYKVNKLKEFGEPNEDFTRLLELLK